MNRTTAAGAALVVLVGLAACSDDATGSDDTAEPTPGSTETSDATGAHGTDNGDSTTDTGDTTGGPDDASTSTDGPEESPDIAVCQEFFGTPGPLVSRVDEAHAQVTEGEWDVTTFGEVQLLSQRLTQLSESADETADLLDRMNAPFIEITDAHADASGNDPYADLGTADTEDSETALTEFMDVCGTL